MVSNGLLKQDELYSEVWASLPYKTTARMVFCDLWNSFIEGRRWAINSTASSTVTSIFWKGFCSDDSHLCTILLYAFVGDFFLWGRGLRVDTVFKFRKCTLSRGKRERVLGLVEY